MAFAGINYGAVLAAAAAAWILGAAWYSALTKPWVAAQGKTMDEFKRQAQAQGAAALLPYGLAFVAELVMAWVLAGVMGHLGQVTLRNGVISALFVWLGFVVTTIGVNNLFGMRKPMLTAIDAGHWLAVLVLMGAIIGLIGV